MSHLIEALISKGSQVITYDALRHGKSHAKRADLADWADSVQAVLQAIGDVDCIIAHSFGAAAVTVASRHGLATKRLIFIAPIHDIVSVSDHFGAELCISPDILKEMRQYTWEQNKERFEAYGKNWEEIFDSPFEVPTLICHDKNDRRIGIEHSLTLRKKWPWAQLIITEGLGHRKILDDARIIQQCCRFIETPL
jgi:pimeloyl-ACP methyl ester carboxylesterase